VEPPPCVYAVDVRLGGVDFGEICEGIAHPASEAAFPAIR
jgi:hypothetical protein